MPEAVGLEAVGVSKAYGHRREVRALSDATIRVAPGQRVALLGPSGSGKSTLARLLAMLEQPDAGRIAVDGELVKGAGLRVPRRLRRQVQLIWQSPRVAVDPRMRLVDILLEPLEATGELSRRSSRRADVAAAWAERLGVTRDLLVRQPHEVSDGQLQRICLGRALVLRPRYLVCDEFSAMLDVSTQASLLAVISDEQDRRELGVLLITHDHVLARSWANVTWRMEAGSVVEATG